MKKFYHASSSLCLLMCVASLMFSGCAVHADDPATLIIQPGLTVRGQKPASWTIDLTAPATAQAAASNLSSRLYGTAEPDGLHAPLVIKTKGKNKVFGFGIAAVSRTGADLEVRLGKQAMWKKHWAPTDATRDVNTIYYFTLPEEPAQVEMEIADQNGVVILNGLYLTDTPDQLTGKTEEIKMGEVKTTQNGRRADGYKGIWFTLGQMSKYGDKYSGGLGTYTANHQPMAVYSAVADKTFFVYGGTTGADERYLLDMVGYYDHKTGMVPRPVVVYDKNGVDDPHDDPSINIDKDGYLWVFVSGRNTSRPGFKFRSKKPYSIDEWEQVTQETMTYPQIWMMPDGNFFHLFTKYTAGRELYFETSPDGRTWSDDQKLVGFGGHYQTSGQWKGKIGTFFNYHPGGDVNKRTNLYYMQTTDEGKTWTKADGTPLEVPLKAIDNPALVIDFAAKGELMYTCDLNWDKDGNPLLLYVTSRDGLPGPQGDPRAFMLSRWDGKAWQTTQVAPTDHNYDMGSLYVNGDTWMVIAPTQPGPQPGQTGGEMALWTSQDTGVTWKMTRQITHDSARNHSYARRPENVSDPFFAFWADGDPTQLSESHLSFCDSSGQHVYQLPYDMTGDFARPVEVTPQKP